MSSLSAPFIGSIFLSTWFVRTEYFYRQKTGHKGFYSRRGKFNPHIFLIDNAIDESEILKKDISCDFRMPRHERTRGMNKYLSHIYSVLRKSKPYSVKTIPINWLSFLNWCLPQHFLLILQFTPFPKSYAHIRSTYISLPWQISELC